jgi:hypothetical protein
VWLRIRIWADVSEHSNNIGFLRRQEIDRPAERLLASEGNHNSDITNWPF